MEEPKGEVEEPKEDIVKIIKKDIDKVEEKDNLDKEEKDNLDKEEKDKKEIIRVDKNDISDTETVDDFYDHVSKIMENKGLKVDKESKSYTLFDDIEE